jgi:class 3 adenylate cyclase/pimeloyl-ACP methyl ester carboxylesterase
VGPTPETRFARTAEGAIGYQVWGKGSRDLIFITNWGTNVDVMWEEPSAARFLDRLGSFARVAFFDKRGSGVSDSVPLSVPMTVEAWMDDARVTADAAGFGRMVVVGDTEGGPMAMLFCATYPDRVSALVLVNSFARFLRSDDYRIGIPAALAARLAELYEQHWGSGDAVALTAPSVTDDARFRRWYARYERLSMPPRQAGTMYSWVQRFDVRAVLSSIQAPTLVINRRDNRFYRPAYGRFLADAIPGAGHVELPGADCLPFFVGADDVLDEVETFVTGTRAAARTDRQLATVLFTDIVDSTVHAVQLGDHRWRDVLDAHHAMVRQQLARFGGREIDTTGDGFLAVFDGPTRAVLSALAIVGHAPDLGVEVRAGLHTGEIELVGVGVAGVAVHIAARVMASAGPRSVMTTSTVRDLAVGSGLEFADRGARELKGVPGTWQLLEVVEAAAN